MPTIITRNCEHCTKPFNVQIKYVNAGRGRFCSKLCSDQNMVRDSVPNAYCDFCGTAFYRSPSKLKSKSGFVFCSTKCKSSAQADDNFAALNPKHYHTSITGNSTTYRKIAFKHYPAECVDCGWDKIEDILQVHHIDHDRSNNATTNLVILCPTCHQIRHWKLRTGLYSPNNGR